MMGQGWVWIGTDGVTSTPFDNATKPEVTQSMQGAIGIRPSGKEHSFSILLQIKFRCISKRP